MPIENRYATALFSGAVTGSANALGPPDSTWTNEAVAVSWSAAFNMSPPTATLTGTQAVRFYVRKDGGSSTAGISSLKIYSDGVVIASNGGVLSVTGALYTSISFDASVVTNPSNLTAEILTTAGGGGPSAKSVIALEHILWEANVADSGAANAGPDQTVKPWATVTLTGTGTGAWSQVSGTPVTLTGTGATVTFTAPPSMTAQALVFAYGTDQMTVNITRSRHGIKAASGAVTPIRFITKK